MTVTRDRLPWWLLMCYGAPALPLAAVTLPVYVQIPKFYAVDMGLGLAAVGGILLAARLWDVVTDPLVGLLSDRTRGRFGRRRPWIVAGAILTAFSAYLLFVPPDGIGTLYLLAVTVLLYLGWTMAMLPYNAWGAELSDDYHRRTTVTAWREGAVIAGTLVAAVIPALSPSNVGDGLWILAIVLMVALPVTVFAAVTVVPDQGAAARQHVPFRQMGHAMAANRPFRRLLSAWFLNGVANGLPATLFLLFVEFGLGAPEQSGLLLLTYFLSAVVGLPLWLWLGKRWGKHRCWCGAMIWACLWFAGVPFLGTGDVTGFLLICIATGLALGADLALPPSLQADVVDVDRAESGERRTGAYFALWGMAQKLALALGVGIAFPLLELAGFNAEAAVSGDERQAGVWALVALYSVAPIVFKVASIVLIWHHPLTETAHAALRQKIAEGN